MDAFLFVKILVSSFVLVFLLMYCAALCRACRSANEERQEHTDTSSIYIIPSPEEDRPYEPPRYSVVDFSDLPPPYMEVEMKPELFPYPEGVPPNELKRTGRATAF